MKPPSEVFISKNVSELLFEGYSDPLLDLAGKLPSGIDLPIPDYDKFGWFYTVCKRRKIAWFKKILIRFFLA